MRWSFCSSSVIDSLGVYPLISRSEPCLAYVKCIREKSKDKWLLPVLLMMTSASKFKFRLPLDLVRQLRFFNTDLIEIWLWRLTHWHQTLVTQTGLPGSFSFSLQKRNSHPSNHPCDAFRTTVYPICYGAQARSHRVKAVPLFWHMHAFLWDRCKDYTDIALKKNLFLLSTNVLLLLRVVLFLFVAQ